jgi:dTDP-4-amino-4,6-dideoxygalactose transaminase
MNNQIIPFNKPYLTGKEQRYIEEAHSKGQLAGDGYFTRLCSNWLEDSTRSLKALLTHSCTAALEMAAILADIQEGDEIIMPSYTFVSTANAFVLRGGIPIFIDIRPDTLNIDETLIEAAITDRTRAIVPVHYAGVACEMDVIMDIADRHNLWVIEDAAQGILSTYKGKALGSIGHMGCFSFHETKNIISGEGGALVINDPNLVQRAEVIREKGTNRSAFFRGQVDKYTWVDLGSSYLPGEIISAFLWAQMEAAREITDMRRAIWNTYDSGFEGLENEGLIIRPTIPIACDHNAHMYYLILPSPEHRSSFLSKMERLGVKCVTHYVPLHSSPMGSKVAKHSGGMLLTTDLANRMVRLPLWLGLEASQESIIGKVLKSLS